MTPQHSNPMIVHKMGEFPSAWCVAEYQVVQDAHNPPVSMFITATKLVDVFTFSEALRNSEWRNCIQDEHQIVVWIISTGTKVECMRHANHLIMTRAVKPRCNMYGHNVFAHTKRIRCSNGEVYESQLEAARMLKINQGAISLHLNGKLKSVGGYTFTYADEIK